MMSVKSRDFILAAAATKRDDGSRILAATSVELPKYPALPDHVRAKLIVGGWILTPVADNSNQTQAVYAVKLDPNGPLSKMVVNMAVKNQAQTIAGLNEYVSKQQTDNLIVLYSQPLFQKPNAFFEIIIY
eukprot:TRINITY_DN6457_c0_g1_i2.p2 TRINITY_DN6457_c0_g1~~TRINITY_DN6457_c0_g1_i2.p2  ORF type:complete len:130 (+),score=35.30 TRINITY_DN6457_c0_g1_i2:421-810(+)